jgi:putative tricarboxylic transport membrane protein
MIRLSKNGLGALGIAAATLFYLAEARTLPFGSIRNPDLGFMPILAGLTLLLLCLLLVAKEVLRPDRPKAEEVDLFEGKEGGTESAGLKKPILLSVAVFFYPLGFIHMGFIVSTILLVTISLRVLEYRGWLGSLVLAIGISLVSFFLFSYLLDVQLPRGLLR